MALKKSFKVLSAILIITLIAFTPLFLHKASAHATLEKSVPMENGVVKNHPEEVQLEFNEPVNSKYSSITIFNDDGKELDEVKPTTSGWSKTLTFPGDDIGEGTHRIQWTAISADGHEVSDSFDFSVGKVTTSDVNTNPPFFEKPSFWFGVMRYITEGLTIILIGLYWMNGIARRNNLSTFDVLPKNKSVASMMIMGYLMSMMTYMMTLNTDVINDILTLKSGTISQFPYLLSSMALIVGYILFILRNMERIWYKMISIAMIITIAMSGHVWSQSIPLWSIILRTAHLMGITMWLGALVYLLISVFKRKQDAVDLLKEILFKVNGAAVLVIIFSGLFMTIDETNILNILTNIQTWNYLLIMKIIGTIIMMILGLIQTTRALNKQRRIHRWSLIVEVLIGILLILLGIIMSQINVPG